MKRVLAEEAVYAGAEAVYITWIRVFPTASCCLTLLCWSCRSGHRGSRVVSLAVIRRARGIFTPRRPWLYNQYEGSYGIIAIALLPAIHFGHREMHGKFYDTSLQLLRDFTPVKRPISSNTD
jgi:hypothetical protein